MAAQSFEQKARELDRADVLAHVRDEFHLQPGVIYMDGNSLGLLSKPAEQSLREMLDAWKRLGIDGWLQGEHPWYHFAEKLGAMAAPFLGAKPDEVIIAGSTSANLHQLLATFFKPEGKRTKLLIEEAAFPTDAYIAKRHLVLHGLDPAAHLVVVPSNGGTRVDERDIVAKHRFERDEVDAALRIDRNLLDDRALRRGKPVRRIYRRVVLCCRDEDAGA